MITKTFSGIEVPALGLGTWRLEGAECKKAVLHALDLGYRHIDTAAAYGNEKEVGKAIRESQISRDEIFLTTKLPWEQLSCKEVLHGFEQSLERLDLPYTDLLLIHWPSTQNIPLEETLEAMKVLKADGKARAIGVSNFPPALLKKALDISNIMCDQVEYHPFLSQQKLLEIAKEHDLMLTAYSPLARGEVMNDPTIDAIADKHGKSPVQVTLRWLIQQPQVVAIPKAAAPEHRATNFNIFDFELTNEEMSSIFALDKGKRLINPEFAPEW